MTDEQTPPNPGLSRATRRALLLAGGTAAVGAVAAVAATPAEAANGSSLILGKTNSSSVMTTLNSTTPSGGAIHVANTGKGHASWFTSTQGNGFIGGTYSAAAQGANVANYAATTGAGTALTASGGVNTGVWAVSNGNTRYAGKFVSGAAAPLEAESGALLADGGFGDGVVGLTQGDPTMFSGVTGVSEGGSGVFGLGFSGVQAYTAPGVVAPDPGAGAGVFVQADGVNTPTTMPVGVIIEVLNGATDAMQATGDVRITGDLFVDGTIHTNHAVDTAWVPTAVAKVRKNSARAASKARAALSKQ